MNFTRLMTPGGVGGFCTRVRSVCCYVLIRFTDGDFRQHRHTSLMSVFAFTRMAAAMFWLQPDLSHAIDCSSHVSHHCD